MRRIVLRESDHAPLRGTARSGGRRLRLYLAYSRADPFFVLAAIMVALGAAWAGCLMLGGSRTPGPHLFYVAIVLAAVRFAWPAALVTACAAGVLAGPLLPADVTMHTTQQPSLWLLRLGIFAGVGLFIAVLVRSPEVTLRSRLRDAVSSARLVRALDEGAIEVFHQPIYRLPDERLVGVEALVRWHQSDDTVVSAGSFIPMAERTGVIAELDAYVLRRAVADARAWARVAPPIAISVNMSAVSLARPDVVSTIARVLEDECFPAGLVQLEITESALIHDVPVAIERVEALRRLGVKVAIDDFGSGHASLNYLQHFPVDVVKVDRSIVTSAAIDDRSERLLEGVVHLCGLLELPVVAEGVEFDDELALLLRLGVPMAQGYLLGRPAPAAAIHALLRAASVE